jgi:Tol biopolymer transport system component
VTLRGQVDLGGDLVVNPADQSIWGVRHNNGFSSVVRIPPPYDTIKPIITLDYGRDIFDLDISPDGTKLSCSLIDVTGRQELALLDIGKLLAGESMPDILHEFKNNSPQNFVFSPDGRYLYGTSYYTGVSNIFRFDLQTRKMEALSNAETGYFRPLVLSADRMFAYR